jgi:hypothetical protein
MSSEERSPNACGPAPVEPESVGRPEKETEESSSYKHLRGLFLDVTGTDTIVETQDESLASRCVTEQSTSGTLSEYVTDMAQKDGLADTLAEPDPGGTPD